MDNILTSEAAREILTNHLERTMNLLNALVFAKKALALQWMLGNIAIIITSMTGISIYLLKDKIFLKKEFGKKVVYSYLVSSFLLIVIIKFVYGNYPAIALILLLGGIALIYSLKDKLFNRNRKNKAGHIIAITIITLINLLIFNTFPQLIKVDSDVEEIFSGISNSVISNAVRENGEDREKTERSQERRNKDREEGRQKTNRR